MKYFFIISENIIEYDTEYLYIDFGSEGPSTLWFRECEAMWFGREIHFYQNLWNCIPEHCNLDTAV